MLYVLLPLFFYYSLLFHLVSLSKKNTHLLRLLHLHPCFLSHYFLFLLSPLPSIINPLTTISCSDVQNDCCLQNTGAITWVHLMEVIAQLLASLLASLQSFWVSVPSSGQQTNGLRRQGATCTVYVLKLIIKPFLCSNWSEVAVSMHNSFRKRGKKLVISHKLKTTTTSSCTIISHIYIVSVSSLCFVS